MVRVGGRYHGRCTHGFQMCVLAPNLVVQGIMDITRGMLIIVLVTLVIDELVSF